MPKKAIWTWQPYSLKNCWPESASDKGTPAFSADLYQRRRICKSQKAADVCLKIDRNNTLAQLYLKEIEEAQQLKKKQGARSNEFLPQKREKRETKVIESQPLSGNDVILPRSSYKEPGNGAITIVNILVGVVIGAALIWF